MAGNDVTEIEAHTASSGVVVKDRPFYAAFLRFVATMAKFWTANNARWSTIYSQRVITLNIPPSASTAIFAFRDDDGNIVSKSAASGFFYIYITDNATGANAYSAISSFIATGNGLLDFIFNAIGTSYARGVAVVTSIGVISDPADISGGAVRLQVVTPASGKTCTATVTFIGQIKD